MVRNFEKNANLCHFHVKTLKVLILETERDREKLMKIWVHMHGQCSALVRILRAGRRFSRAHNVICKGTGSLSVLRPHGLVLARALLMIKRNISETVRDRAKWVKILESHGFSMETS